MNYDVVFMDLDGTLLRDDKSIPDNNINALKKMNEMGIDIVIASGRSYMSLKNMNDELGIGNIKGYNIAFNGSSIFERCPYNLIYDKKIDSKTSLHIHTFLKSFNAEIFVYADNMLWVENITDTVIRYSRHSMILPKRTRNLRQACKLSANKIITIGDNKKLKEIQREFYNTKMCENINCCFSSNNLLEFNTVNDNKGTAVKYIMNLPEFKGKRSLAIGDSYNDIPMLEECDFSLVPSNSNAEVKNSAKAVLTTDNNDGILSEVLEKYII